MQIRRTRAYQVKLISILTYIAEDKTSASKKFLLALDQQINNLPSFPYKYKQSIYFEDKNIRDMTYKKYTINYHVNLNNDSIDILNIFNKNKPI